MNCRQFLPVNELPPFPRSGLAGARGATVDTFTSPMRKFENELEADEGVVKSAHGNVRFGQQSRQASRYVRIAGTGAGSIMTSWLHCKDSGSEEGCEAILSMFSGEVLPGFTALILDPSGSPLEVYLSDSVDLPSHWSRLDEFEGPGYRRVVTQVHTGHVDLSAHIYVAR